MMSIDLQGFSKQPEPFRAVSTDGVLKEKIAVIVIDLCLQVFCPQTRMVKGFSIKNRY